MATKTILMGHLEHELGGRSHGPQRTLYAILGSLVSGMQHLFQHNWECLEPTGAGTQEPPSPPTSGSSSFWKALDYIGLELNSQLHGPQRRYHFQAL